LLADNFQQWLLVLRENWQAVLLVIVLSASGTFIWLSVGPQRTKPSYGLGPEWDCKPIPNSEPVCIKHVNPAK
jgi:hypothetical protein